ncbi:hypothetical protein ABW19_dt0208402 [Dactylella cylindrospora]|nr:hypothetical protein ABW19_dt0208402 [Dactylella cylindrospora]
MARLYSRRGEITKEQYYHLRGKQMENTEAQARATAGSSSGGQGLDSGPILGSDNGAGRQGAADEGQVIANGEVEGTRETGAISIAAAPNNNLGQEAPPRGHENILKGKLKRPAGGWSRGILAGSKFKNRRSAMSLLSSRKDSTSPEPDGKKESRKSRFSGFSLFSVFLGKGNPNAQARDEKRRSDVGFIKALGFVRRQKGFQDDEDAVDSQDQPEAEVRSQGSENMAVIEPKRSSSATTGGPSVESQEIQASSALSPHRNELVKRSSTPIQYQNKRQSEAVTRALVKSTAALFGVGATHETGSARLGFDKIINHRRAAEVAKEAKRRRMMSFFRPGFLAAIRLNIQHAEIVASTYLQQIYGNPPALGILRKKLGKIQVVSHGNAAFANVRQKNIGKEQERLLKLAEGEYAQPKRVTYLLFSDSEESPALLDLPVSDTAAISQAVASHTHPVEPAGDDKYVPYDPDVGGNSIHLPSYDVSFNKDIEHNELSNNAAEHQVSEADEFFMTMPSIGAMNRMVLAEKGFLPSDFGQEEERTVIPNNVIKVLTPLEIPSAMERPVTSAITHGATEPVIARDPEVIRATSETLKVDAGSSIPLEIPESLLKRASTVRKLSLGNGNLPVRPEKSTPDLARELSRPTSANITPMRHRRNSTSFGTPTTPLSEAPPSPKQEPLGRDTSFNSNLVHEFPLEFLREKARIDNLRLESDEILKTTNPTRRPRVRHGQRGYNGNRVESAPSAPKSASTSIYRTNSAAQGSAHRPEHVGPPGLRPLSITPGEMSNFRERQSQGAANRAIRTRPNSRIIGYRGVVLQTDSVGYTPGYINESSENGYEATDGADFFQ